MSELMTRERGEAKKKGMYAAAAWGGTVVLGVVGSGLGVAPRAAVVGTTGRTVARAVGRAVACVIGRALRTPGGAVAAGNPGTSPFPSTGMAGSGPVTLDEFATRRTTPT